MRDQDEGFPRVSMRQGRDLRHPVLAIILLGGASGGAGNGAQIPSSSVRGGCPHGVVWEEGDTT